MLEYAKQHISVKTPPSSNYDYTTKTVILIMRHQWASYFSNRVPRQSTINSNLPVVLPADYEMCRERSKHYHYSWTYISSLKSLYRAPPHIRDQEHFYTLFLRRLSDQNKTHILLHQQIRSVDVPRW